MLAVPKQRIVEATRGAILARGADGIPLLFEQLSSDDEVMVSIGLFTARELSGAGVSQKLMASRDKLSTDRQALLVLAMADRQDTEALPALLGAAKSGPTAVRVAALKVISRLGDVTSVSPLLVIATEDNKQVSQAAMENTRKPLWRRHRLQVDCTACQGQRYRND